MTNPTLETLMTRRSCRSFENRQISEQELDAVLKAGIYAPTAMGAQSPKIVVIQDAETRTLLSRLNASMMGAENDPMYGAPTILLVLAPADAKNGVQDASLVMGNLMNAAASLGLGSCWINRAKEELLLPEGRELLEKWGLSDAWVGVGHCILGYPAAAPAAAKPRKADYILRV